MADQDDQFVPEAEFQAWLTPPQALAVLGHMDVRTAAHEIIRRARAGRIAVGADLSWIVHPDEDRSLSRFKVPPNWLRDAAAIDHVEMAIWSTGGWTFTVKRGSSANRRTQDYEAFNIRFERSAVLEMRAKAPPASPEMLAAAIRDAAAPAATDPQPQFPHLAKHAAMATDKPVSEPKLIEWFKAWRVLYPADLQNNDTAWEHARLTFPKNHVARHRIRSLRDVRTPGRKRTAEIDGDPAE